AVRIAEPAAPSATPRASLTRAVAIAALLVILSAGAWFATRRAPTATRPSRPIIAVAVFENDTGDPGNERAVAGLSDVIVERLTALGTSRVGINGNANILRRPRAARDERAVARETGASFLIYGALQ